MTAIKTCKFVVYCDGKDAARAETLPLIGSEPASRSSQCRSYAEIETDIGHISVVDVEIRLRAVGWSVSKSRQQHMCPAHKRGSNRDDV